METLHYDDIDAAKKIREIIDGRVEAIAREYERSSNPWLACCGTVLFQIETYLWYLPDKEKGMYEARVEYLKQMIHYLWDDERYHQKGFTPDVAVSREILQRLDIFHEPYPECDISET